MDSKHKTNESKEMTRRNSMTKKRLMRNERLRLQILGEIKSTEASYGK